MSASNSSQLKYNYVYDLPYLPLRDLARILDDNNQWKELGGGFMKYDITTLNEFGRSPSPTEMLLANWGQKNHTILELFILLSKMQHFRALEILKPYVQEKYHVLCDRREVSVTKLLNTQLGTSERAASAAIPVLSLSRTEEGACAMKPDADSCNFNNCGTDRMLASKLGSFKLANEARQDLISKSDNVQGQASWNSPQVRVPDHPHREVAVINRPEQPRRDSESSTFSEMSSASAMANIPPIDELELATATNLWNSASIIGRGGFGTVYKGTWKNTQVAIKRMENKGEAGANLILQQSMGELRILHAIRHDNILPLYGYSLGGSFPCLVYQYMPNGSLEDRLLCRQGTYPLNWELRLSIGRGTSRGLQFLHTIRGTPLIHGDIKSANILLDKNLEPKIGDFGLAREGPQTHYTHMKVSHVHGTRPYLPDEYLRGRKISTKVDTYSFGIVLFELGTGLRAYDASRPQGYAYLREYVENSDKIQLKDVKAGDDYLNIYMSIMTLGSTCAKLSAKERPEMVQVLKYLDDLALQTEPFSNHHHHQWPSNRTRSPMDLFVMKNDQRDHFPLRDQPHSPPPQPDKSAAIDLSNHPDYMPAFEDLMSSTQFKSGLAIPDLDGLMVNESSVMSTKHNDEDDDSDSESSESISSISDDGH